jgi:hypothetical protein
MQQRRQQVGMVNKVGVPNMGCHSSLSRDMLTVGTLQQWHHLSDFLGNRFRVVNELSADLALTSMGVDRALFLLHCGVHFVFSSLAEFCSTSLGMKLSGGKTGSFTAINKISYIGPAPEPFQFSFITLGN